jgi:hypothetical protein
MGGVTAGLAGGLAVRTSDLPARSRGAVLMAGFGVTASGAAGCTAGTGAGAAGGGGDAAGTGVSGAGLDPLCNGAATSAATTVSAGGDDGAERLQPAAIRSSGMAEIAGAEGEVDRVMDWLTRGCVLRLS